jgi:subtilisin family serine protease
MSRSASTVLLALLLATPGLAQERRPVVSLATTPDEIELVGNTPYVEGQFIARFPQSTSMDEAGAFFDPERYVVVEALMPTIDMFLVEIVDGTSVLAAMAEMRDNPWLLYAAPDHVVEKRATTPNDPSFGSQWNMSQFNDNDIDAPEAWDLGTGSTDYVVAVVDGGMYVNHPDLKPNLYQNALEVSGLPGVDDDGNGYVDDKNGWDAYGNDGVLPGDGHGSHVNGIVGAKGNNGLGVTGVNWDVTLMPVAGSTGTTSIVVRAYNYVLAQKTLWLSSGGTTGANAVATNSSFGVNFGNCTSATYRPWNDAYDAMGAVGILSAAATMNISADVDVSGDVPTSCSSDWLISVTNTTSSDTLSSGAAWGLNTIDLGAPGSGILSTGTPSGYNTLSGTSMASPHAAGAVAFLHSVASSTFQAAYAADPAAGAKELKDIMLNNVDPLPSLAGKTVSGGRLNLWNAALAINTWTGTGGGGLQITSISPSTVDALIPGSGQTVSINGTGFKATTQVAVDGVALGGFPSPYTYVNSTLITFDMPTLTKLGPVSVDVTEGLSSDSSTVTVAPPATPKLQIGTGDEPVTLFSFSGADVTVSAQPSDLFLLYFSSDLISSPLPGIVTFSIGNNFTTLWSGGFYVIDPTQAWTGVNIPFSGIPALSEFYFQGVALSASPTFPLAVSNTQHVRVIF